MLTSENFDYKSRFVLEFLCHELMRVENALVWCYGQEKDHAIQICTL